MRKILCFFLLAVTSIGFVFADSTKEEHSRFFPVVGLTVDDAWYEELNAKDIAEALAGYPYRATLRVVMDPAEPIEKYLPMLELWHSVAEIMLCPVDSSEMAGFTSVESYVARFAECYALLGPYVSLWEIGNEINGEGWLGDSRDFIAEKMQAAYGYCEEQGIRTVLTAYYTKPGVQEVEMLDWLVRYVPQHMRKGLYALLVSYYEDDNEGYQPDWQAIFNHLADLFPNSYLGIGECGVLDKTLDDAAILLRLEHYYHMPQYTERFLGGYFWWHWVQDALLQEGKAASFFEALKDGRAWPLQKANPSSY